MKSIFFAFIFICFAHTAFSQDVQIPVVDTETELYFSDALIYEYKTIEGEKREFWIYVQK